MNVKHAASCLLYRPACICKAHAANEAISLMKSDV